MDIERKLKEIFENDPLGLLNPTQSNSTARTADERLIASFEEINTFYDQHSREPKQGNGVQEMMLYARLKGIRENEGKCEALKEFDRYNLLDIKPKQINSIDDILSDDSLGLLNTDEASLFDLKHVKPTEQRDTADMIARRKPCKDFELYEPLFKQVHADLKNGERRVIPFSEFLLKEGVFFVINGMMGYLQKTTNLKKDRNHKLDGRTRTVFENGTESELLYRSLGKALFDNGYLISENARQTEDAFLKEFNVITEEDKESGYIYVLQSKSEDPKIKSIDNLYKIGYSEIDVKDRIKNAKNEPTYLMADVKLVTAFKCYNMNAQKLELLLHTFFGKACLNIDVFDAKGGRHTPREWFIAPILVIEQALNLIIDGTVVNYLYDHQKERIIER